MNTCNPVPFNSQTFPKHLAHNDGKSDLAKLFVNRASAVMIDDFASATECNKLVQALHELGYETYLDVYPPIGRIGVTQFEAQKHGKAWYFNKAQTEYNKQKIAFAQSFDPIKRLLLILQQHFPEFNVGIAKENDTPYYAGLVRQINNTALTHADFAPYDAEDWVIANVIAQLAFNVCIKSPAQGGECVVYNKSWQILEDERLRLENSYGYDNKIIANCGKHILKPQEGQAYFFNSRNFHEVWEGVGERITLSCFVGLTPYQEIIIWS